MADTPNLEMPEIGGSQTTKHTTHNEALRLIDNMGFFIVLDKDLSDAPSAAADGEAYIIATGTSSGDEWDDAANNLAEENIAYYSGTAWKGIPVRAGMFAYVVDEGKLYYFPHESTGWTDTALL